MIRLLLSLAVIGLVLVMAMRTLGSPLSSVSAVAGAGPAASDGAAATPRAAVNQVASAVHQALQAGATLQEHRASEAGR